MNTNDSFVREDLSEENEESEIIVDADEAKPLPPYETSEESAEYPEVPAGVATPVADENGKSPKSITKVVVGVAIIIVFTFLVFGLLIWNKKKDTKESIAVQSNSNVSREPTNDEILKAISNVTAQVSPQPSQSPANGEIVDPLNGANPLAGVPVFDPNKPVNQTNETGGGQTTGGGLSSNQPNGGGGSGSGGGGGGGFGSGASADRVPNAPPKAQTDKPVVLPPVANKENGGYADRTGDADSGNSGGRNSQRSYYYKAKNPIISSPGNNNLLSSLYKPPFGSILPVRTLGKLHTLQSGGLVRLELTRSVEGRNWRLGRGTIFVGRVQGGSADRLFVSLIGFIDSRSNTLVDIKGDVLSGDGGLGFEGKRKRLTNRWKKVLGTVFDSAKQLASAYLLGRRGGGGGGYIPLGDNSGVESLIDSVSSQDNGYFIVVEAGSEGFIMVNDLPPAATNVPTAPGTIENETRLGINNPKLSDDQLVKLISSGTPDEIKNAIPYMSPAWAAIARRALDPNQN